MLPELGEAGQNKLLQARVLLAGAGGNGSAAALYLAAAGVGKLGIVDFDTVDESNLQRQVLHTTLKKDTGSNSRWVWPEPSGLRKAKRTLPEGVRLRRFCDSGGLRP